MSAIRFAAALLATGITFGVTLDVAEARTQRLHKPEVSVRYDEAKDHWCLRDETPRTGTRVPAPFECRTVEAWQAEGLTITRRSPAGQG